MSVAGAGGKESPAEGPTGSLSALHPGAQLPRQPEHPPGLFVVALSLGYSEKQASSGSARTRAGVGVVIRLDLEGCVERVVERTSSSADGLPGPMTAALAALAPSRVRGACWSCGVASVAAMVSMIATFCASCNDGSPAPGGCAATATPSAAGRPAHEWLGGITASRAPARRDGG